MQRTKNVMGGANFWSRQSGLLPLERIHDLAKRELRRIHSVELPLVEIQLLIRFPDGSAAIRNSMYSFATRAAAFALRV
jgi:hypothetical protein